MKLRHKITKFDDKNIPLLNDNLKQLSEHMSLDNFAGGEINTGTVIINKTVIQAPVVTTEGSDLNGAYITPGSVDADKINVTNLTSISSDLGEATSGSLVVGDDNNKLWLNDSNDGGLAIGGSVKANAPFKVDNLGNVVAESATITGEIYSTGGELTGITEANVDVGPYGNVRGGQTDFMSGTGFFIGKSGDAHKVSVGNADNYFSFDGTNLRVAGNIILNSALQVYSVLAGNLPVPPTTIGPSNPSGVE